MCGYVARTLCCGGGTSRARRQGEGMPENDIGKRMMRGSHRVIVSRHFGRQVLVS